MLTERLRNDNEDKTKTQITQSFNQYSENETNIWRQNILTQFNRVSSSYLRSHFVISPLLLVGTNFLHRLTDLHLSKLIMTVLTFRGVSKFSSVNTASRVN